MSIFSPATSKTSKRVENVTTHEMQGLASDMNLVIY